MKAITVRQPWASLIAAGVKTIETRPRPTRYRGRIAIHAGKTPLSFDEAPPTEAETNLGWWGAPPLGAVVASAVLTDSVPIVDGDGPLRQGRYVSSWPGNLKLVDREGGSAAMRCVDDQLPFGDFRPGRWALLLDDIKPTTERCPACWGTGHRGPCGRACQTCEGLGRGCDPVPARGQQAVPWEWTP